jgi:hypothetical protein
MTEPSPVPPISTFVVHFWHEWSAAGSRWRGRIEHVQSGESTAFVGLGGMLDFIRRFTALPTEAEQSTWDRAGRLSRASFCRLLQTF